MTQKTFRKTIAAIMAAMLMFIACSASGTEAEDAHAIQTNSTDELFLSLTESTSKSMAFPLTKEQAAQVEKAGTDRVTWTLHRVETYADSADGKFISLRGEEKMFPNEKETIDFATIKFSDMYEAEQPFSMKSFETTLDGSTLKLDFTTSPVTSLGNAGIPHESGGSFLDICGRFTLVAELDGAPLASFENVTIKPYASFHTMWEMYDEMLRLAGEGDNDPATSRPYVEYGVMGQSYLGHDMPYLIVARDSASVQKWQALSERAEETGSAVIEERMRSGDDDYQIPVMYSNIHANEISCADAILEFARLLIEEPVIEYTKLTGFTVQRHNIMTADTIIPTD